MTGAEFAVALGHGWSQPKISKIETGRQLPTEAELAAWAAATGTDLPSLLALRRDASAEYSSYRERITRAGGAVANQLDLTALAASSTFLAAFQPALVPGRLQTPAYMREKAMMTGNVTTPDELGNVIAAKVRRQAILYEPGREFVHVVTEAALRLRIGAMTATTLRSQLAHLADLAELPGHTFAVLPFTVACPVEPTSGFRIYDRDLVRVETMAGVLQLTEPDAVARYSRWLDQLLEVAITGAEAAAFCREVAAMLPD